MATIFPTEGQQKNRGTLPGSYVGRLVEYGLEKRIDFEYSSLFNYVISIYTHVRIVASNLFDDSSGG
jgi:hypothetical protein